MDGVEADVEVSTLQDGGLFWGPIPGDLLFTVHDEPQVISNHQKLHGSGFLVFTEMVEENSGIFIFGQGNIRSLQKSQRSPDILSILGYLSETRPERVSILKCEQKGILET